MIEDYIRQIDDLLSTNSNVAEVIVLRRRIWNTDWEKVLNYRYRIMLTDGSLIEMTERVLEIGNELKITKYSHHWQDKQEELIQRWDNAPHYRDIETFPHHVHVDSEDNVLRHPATTGFEVLTHILGEYE